MAGRLYGNSSMGFGYSPDKSREVDRFNPSTRANYPAYSLGDLNDRTWRINNGLQVDTKSEGKVRKVSGGGMVYYE